jgi:peroxiredoxin
MAGPEIGDRAPEFTLRRGLNEVVELRALRARGPVLLAFYVFDFGHF